MTKRLKLICHAATPQMRAAAFPSDAPLETAARARLAAVSYLAPTQATCEVSPALCARQTAEGLGLAATVVDLLRDIDYGRWRGLEMETVAAREPEAFARWLSDPSAAPHGGEAIAALIDRVGHWMDHQHATAGTTIALTHASVIRAAIVHALDAPPSAFWRIDVAPLSVTSLTGLSGRWNLGGLAVLATKEAGNEGP